MIGTVEIYSDYGLPTEQKLLSENNTIVDGFGEQLAQMMTTSPSLAMIPSASSLLDTSNYTVRAISFSKDASAFVFNAHASGGLPASGRDVSQVWVNSTTSSYVPVIGLPSFTDPLDEKLQVTVGNLSAIDLYGQNLNLIRYCSSIGLDASVGLRYGCWPNSHGTTVKLFHTTTSAFIISASLSSTFNLASSMDWRGFVNTTLTGDPTRGLVVSAYSLTSSLSPSAGIMKHFITIASGDLACANLYGGIYQVGLWGLDIQSLLCRGRTPPYIFNPINTLDYNLMAKKSLTVNLSKIADSGSSPGLLNYQNLTLVWIFRFV